MPSKPEERVSSVSIRSKANTGGIGVTLGCRSIARYLPGLLFRGCMVPAQPCEARLFWEKNSGLSDGGGPHTGVRSLRRSPLRVIHDGFWRKGESWEDCRSFLSFQDDERWLTTSEYECE
mmetsp:Transcript_621/g.1278  ORF Transcript_621/g.1278 Transcript_621/m.1278 type:complete len:120 (+) Transcript_621:1098-1457(+)